MVSGCHGWTGQTAPAVVESRSDTEAVFLLAMVEDTVPSSLDRPISPWKLVRLYCFYWKENMIVNSFSSSPEQCPDVGCANTSCPPGLLRYLCAPCPVSCAHISTGTICSPSPVPCSSGHHNVIRSSKCTVATLCRTLGWFCSKVLHKWRCYGAVLAFTLNICYSRLLVSRGLGDEPPAAMRAARGVCVWGGWSEILARSAHEGGLRNMRLWARKAPKMPA